MVAVLCMEDDIDWPGPRGRERTYPYLVEDPPLSPVDNAIDRALIVGDMHGNLFAWERTILKAARKSRANVIIQVGDFGYGWDEDYLPTLDMLLAEIGIPVLWLDGNHENFDKLTTIGAFPGVDPNADISVMTSHNPVPLLPPMNAPVQTSEYTWYLPRGFCWEWYGRRMLAVGGAYSVDKPYRKAHESWWEQEELTDRDVEVARSHGEVNVVFSHDVFAGVQVPGIHAEWKQDEFGALSAANRDRLLDVKHTARPSLWIAGHYHVGYEMPVADGMTLVGLNRESEYGSCMTLDFPSLEWSAP